jgi:hypothetical protein
MGHDKKNISKKKLEKLKYKKLFPKNCYLWAIVQSMERFESSKAVEEIRANKVQSSLVEL